MATFVDVHPDNPQPRSVAKVVERIREGALVAFPTVDNAVFRAVKAATPGPYTFILPGTKDVPKRLLHTKKKTVGVRIPDNPLTQALLAGLGDAMLTSTLLLPGEERTPTFGWDVKEALDHQVDIVIDAGEVSTEPTTVVDLSGDGAEIARYGAGDPTPFE